MRLEILLADMSRASTRAGAHGCKVAVTGRRQAVLNEAQEQLHAAGIEALGLQGDVRKREDCERWAQSVADTFGCLHILVNCAAGAASPVCNVASVLVQHAHGC
jgi:NAD(P)-dependent dehydrogenase (short-subunit alcohol dehydrogenase family)